MAHLMELCVEDLVQNWSIELGYRNSRNNFILDIYMNAMVKMFTDECTNNLRQIYLDMIHFT